VEPTLRIVPKAGAVSNKKKLMQLQPFRTMELRETPNHSSINEKVQLCCPEEVGQWIAREICANGQ
jgi:hypothetical protein